MKKIVYLILSVISLIGVASCSDDNGDFNYKDIGDIKIEGIEDSYRVLTSVKGISESIEGDILEISPKIESRYKDSELEYYWYLIDPMKEGVYGESEKYEGELISRDKNLSYKVDIPLKDYIIVFKVVSKTDGYANNKMIDLTVASKFSTGYYILKENSEGNTSLDLFSWNEKLGNEVFSRDVLDFQGVAINGAPRSLGVIYGQAYRAGDEQFSTNTLCITSESNDMKFIDLKDMSIIKDLSNAFYYAIDEDFEPYITIRGYADIVNFSNKGISRSTAETKYNNGLNYGKLSVPEGNGASKYVIYNNYSNYTYFWSNATRSICSIDWNGSDRNVDSDTIPASKINELPDNMKVALGTKYGYRVENLEDMTCIAIGTNYIGEESSVNFILENNKKERYLYILSAIDGNLIVTNVVSLDMNLNLAQSDIICTNGTKATVVYCVNNNKLYSHNLDYSGATNSKREKELLLEGLPTDETITYLTNQYWVGEEDDDIDNIDYLIVVTQKGNNYTIYFYETLGGEPKGTPKKTVSGEGKFKSVHYVASGFDYLSDNYPRAY